MVIIAIPDWMRTIGVDIRIIGLFSIAQLPWSLKYLWAPLIDRYTPPWLGRRRGWAVIAQLALAILTLCLAGVGSHPDAPWVIAALALAIAFASATQDIALDAYTVDVLKEEEYGTVAGARVAFYRLAMLSTGGIAISLAARTSWPTVNVILASLYLLMMFVTSRAPEPQEKQVPPQSLKDAVWLPFLGFLARNRAIEILMFVIFYKFADNLAEGLRNPFLVDMGYSADQRGIALKTVGLVCMLSGTFLGGFLTTIIGLGHCLWIFGGLQIFSNVGYVLLSTSPVNVPLFYASMGFETFAQGLATGAFSVLLLRLTQKRFSATQYALFTSMFAVTRVLGGVLSGLSVDALGWTNFYYMTIFAGIPGLILLQRFSPLGIRDPQIEAPTQLPAQKHFSNRRSLFYVGCMAAIAFLCGSIVLALLNYVKKIRADTLTTWGQECIQLFSPETIVGWLQIVGILVFTISIGLCTAAYLVAKKKR